MIIDKRAEAKKRQMTFVNALCWTTFEVCSVC